MAALNDKVKAFIIHGFANFLKPHEIIQAVKEEFDIDVSRQQVCFYNPSTENAAKELSKKWIDLFNTYREQAISDTSNLWIAHTPQRLKKYQEEFEKTKSPKIKLEILKQAAQDAGGIFINDSTMSDDEMQSNAQPVNVIVEVKDARRNAEPEHTTSAVSQPTE